jgi:hypothetical protein
VKDRCVEVGLVADLKGSQRRAERLDVSGRLGRVRRRVVTGQVQTQDHPGVDRVGQTGGDGQPAGGQPIAGVHGSRCCRRAVPRHVGAVTADPQHRGLSGAEPAHERLEHRVDRRRVTAGVGADRLKLDRQAEKPSGHGAAGRPEREVDRAGGRGGGPHGGRVAAAAAAPDRGPGHERGQVEHHPPAHPPPLRPPLGVRPKTAFSDRQRTLDQPTTQHNP